MARANVYKETTEQNKKSRKGLIATLSILGVAVIAGIVALTLWLTGAFNKKESFTYFDDLKDYKINASEINKKLKEYESVFIFVYNNDEFDAKTSADDTEYDQEDEKMVEQVKKIIEASKAANEKVNANVFYCYIIDTSINDNNTVLNNTSYGNITSAPSMLYFYHEVYNSTVPEALKKQIDKRYEDITLSNTPDNKKAFVSNLIEIKNMINSFK